MKSPLERIVEALEQPSNWLDGLLESIPQLSTKNSSLYKELRPHLLFVLDRFYDVRVSGAGNIMHGKSTIILGKHQSTLDLFLGTYIEEELPDIIAKDTLYRPVLPGNLTKHFFNFAGVIPIDRSSPKTSRQTMKRAFLHSIRRGNHLLLFPEGRRYQGWVGPLRLMPFEVLEEAVQELQEQKMNLDDHELSQIDPSRFDPHIVPVGAKFQRPDALPYQAINIQVGEALPLSVWYARVGARRPSGLRGLIKNEIIALSGDLPTRPPNRSATRDYRENPDKVTIT